MPVVIASPASTQDLGPSTEPSLPRELHLETPRFHKNIEITAPSESNAAQHALHAEISNWSQYDVMLHGGTSQVGPVLAASRFHSRRAELCIGDPNKVGAMWVELQNENRFGMPKFLVSATVAGAMRTFRWERTRDGDDGVKGKHYRMRDCQTGHVVALYVKGNSARKGTLVYRDALGRNEGLLVLISAITVLVKGRRRKASSAGIAGAVAGAGAAGGGGGA